MKIFVFCSNKKYPLHGEANFLYGNLHSFEELKFFNKYFPLHLDKTERLVIIFFLVNNFNSSFKILISS